MDSTADAAAKRPRPSFKSQPVAPKKPPKLGPPDFSEWSDFIGTVVLRWVARAFVAVALRGVDRALLSEQEESDLDLDNEQLEAIAKPIAHLAARNSFMTKHGREILDSKDAIEALVIFFMWGGRVRRIAKKYNPNPTPRRKKNNNGNDSSGEPVSEEPEEEGRPVFSGTAIGHGYN